MPFDSQLEKRPETAKTFAREDVLNISEPRVSLLGKSFFATEARRSLVIERDHGICALCGLDCYSLHVALGYIHARIEAFAPGWDVHFVEVKRAIGSIARSWPDSLWEVDHIYPSVLGGDDVAENWRTLCLNCHKAETAKLKTWMSEHPLARVLGTKRVDRYKPTLKAAEGQSLDGEQ